MKYHMLAFALGFLLDGIIGDPYWMPHPIRLIGNLIAKADLSLLGSEEEIKKKKRDAQRETSLGICLVLIVILFTGISSLFLLSLAYRIHVYVGLVVEAVLTAYCLAGTSLKKESEKVYSAITDHSIPKEQALVNARKAVSMIVGRDTDCLDESGVIKAAVETVAENTSDGVIAPMIYLYLGGPVLGLLYKAINTMDSMVGYHNERYEHFGTAAAKLDDFVNYLPARISAIYLIGAAKLLGKEFDASHATEIYYRDRRNHKSPNSAQTESVVAGALGVELAGNAKYFGKIVEKPTIGDALRPIEAEDILRANRMMQLAAFLSFIDGEILLFIVYWLSKLAV